MLKGVHTLVEIVGLVAVYIGLVSSGGDAGGGGEGGGEAVARGAAACGRAEHRAGDRVRYASECLRSLALDLIPPALLLQPCLESSQHLLRAAVWSRVLQRALCIRRSYEVALAQIEFDETLEDVERCNLKKPLPDGSLGA
eukprot:5912460-Pleurochrysis_carterae.AAC.1